MLAKCCGVLRALTALAVLLLAAPSAFASPSYTGTFVIVDPYGVSGMQFLQCAAATLPKTSCEGLAASNSGFVNPFTDQEASGIFLWLPWCGFQVAAAAGETSFGAAGECHYQLEGSSGIGSYVAGAFAPGGTLQFPGQASTDQAIGNLSTCANVVYDTCPASVLGQAMAYIAQINAQATTKIGLSIALIAGQYTPQSVMNASGVGYIDLAKVDSKHGTFCARGPLAWQPAYAQYYTKALNQLAHYIHRPGFDSPPIVILKQAAMAANSAEFDVPATTITSGYQTAIDPALAPAAGGSGTGIGPQGDAAIQCPDQTPYVSGVGALLNQYQLHGIAGETMANAYEAAFGFITGYEAGMLAENGAVGSVLSIATKGQQNFAHVACGTNGDSACIPDPNPVHGSQFAWSQYYFTKFVNDLFVPGSMAETHASSGFTTACKGRSCANDSYALEPWQVALVYTGLDPTQSGVSYTWVPTCWLNNTNAQASVFTAPATLLLYTSPSPHPTSTTVVVIGPPPVAPAPAGGTMLGWQTLTTSGGACENGTYSLKDAIRNGGQFVELQTDAASEPTCAAPLRHTLSDLLAPNDKYGCDYD
jgi:hypothetical protein